MLLLIVGLIVLLVWAILAASLGRTWRLWERAPLRRIGDIRTAEVVKLSGHVRARTPERVLAPLSGALDGKTSRSILAGKRLLRGCLISGVLLAGSGGAWLPWGA